MDEPSYLYFSVIPSLPAGVLIDASDGTLSGVPSAPMQRTAYTISAASGYERQASTTTIFLTVRCKSEGCNSSPAPPPAPPLSETNDQVTSTSSSFQPGGSETTTSFQPGESETVDT